MRNIRIVKHRKWTPEEIRTFCIHYQYYTRGDNKAYDNMLCFVGNNPPTTENIFVVAMNILQHSNVNEVETEDIIDLMNEIELLIVSVKYECVDEEEIE